MTLGLAAALLVFTGIWHTTEWMMGGRNKDTARLIPFGILYALLGYFIAVGTGGVWTVIIALILTLIGITGAFMIRKTAMVRGWVMWTFIVIDVIIIAALIMGLMG